MPAAPTSPLDKLHDVIIVEQVSAWPPAPIWYLVALLAISSLISLFIYLKKQHQYKSAKREAITLANSVLQKNQPLTISDLNQLQHILKRLAKHYYGDKTAAFTGKRWSRFIADNCNTACEENSFKLLYQAKLADDETRNLKLILSNAIKKMNIKKSKINSYKLQEVPHV
jgi:hypothetical protein